MVMAGDPVAANDPLASATAGDVAPSGEAAGTSRFAGFGGGPLPVDAGAAGLGTLAAISAVSLSVTLLRRSRSRRRLAARIAARLASFGTPADGPRDPNPAEREPSTIHAA
jgi:hypothetical protein